MVCCDLKQHAARKFKKYMYVILKNFFKYNGMCIGFIVLHNNRTRFCGKKTCYMKINTA
jgi:hypothetical protein